MCTELIARCEVCEFIRHMFWECCRVNYAAKVDAAKAIDTPGPDPANCPNLEKPVVKVKIRPEACPTDNPECGGLRKRRQNLILSGTAAGNTTVGAHHGATQEEAEEQERRVQIHNQKQEEQTQRQRQREEDPDVAVTSYNTIDPTTPAATRVFLLGPKSRIKYAKNYKEAGEKGVKLNKNNMNMPYALHAGYTRSDPSWLTQPENVRVIHNKYRYNQDTNYFRDWNVKWLENFPLDSMFDRVEDPPEDENEQDKDGQDQEPDPFEAPPSTPPSSPPPLKVPARWTEVVPRHKAHGFMPRIEEEDENEDECESEGVGRVLATSLDSEPQLLQELFLGG